MGSLLTVNGSAIRPKQPPASPSERGSALSLPPSTHGRASGQEDPAHDDDPHEADDGRNEPRIDPSGALHRSPNWRRLARRGRRGNELSTTLAHVSETGFITGGHTLYVSERHGGCQLDTIARDLAKGD